MVPWFCPVADPWLAFTTVFYQFCQRQGIDSYYVYEVYGHCTSSSLIRTWTSTSTKSLTWSRQTPLRRRLLLPRHDKRGREKHQKRLNPHPRGRPKDTTTPWGVDGSGEVLGKNLRGPNLRQQLGGEHVLVSDRGEVQCLEAGVDKEALWRPLGTNEDKYWQIFVHLLQHS